MFQKTARRGRDQILRRQNLSCDDMTSLVVGDNVRVKLQAVVEFLTKNKYSTPYRIYIRASGETVDTLALGASAARHESSSLSSPTINKAFMGFFNCGEASQFIGLRERLEKSEYIFADFLIRKNTKTVPTL